MKILLGTQDLLNNPNPKDPAQAEAYTIFLQTKKEHEERIKKQTEQFSIILKRVLPFLS